jgi:multicomponent Na+:H+ antiporter subunit E
MLFFGLVSCAMVVVIAARMDVVDEEAVPIHLHPGRMIGYVVWLIVEIIRANIDVTRRILDPRLPIRPDVRRVAAVQKTRLGRVIYANSITLTPGTVSMDVGDDTILVHALNAEGLRDLEHGEMARRVCALEE